LNAEYAFTVNLDPYKYSIFSENVDPKENPFFSELVNVIAARTKDKDNEVCKKVVEAYQTPEVEKVLNELYKGAYIPVWEGAQSKF